MNSDIYGLIGDPIGKSLSPALFKAGYGGALRYDLIEGPDFLLSWKRFLESYRAINVTAPFKELAFAQAAALARDGYGEISGPCMKTGATNLLVKERESGKIMAYNTDFTGIILSVAECMFPGLVRQCHEAFGEKAHIKVHQFARQNLEEYFGHRPQALVVGCGGAGKAAAVAAAEMGFSTILMNRTEARAREFALELTEYGFIVDPIGDFRGAFRECELVIYTLPSGLEAVGGLDEEERKGDAGVPKMVLEANYKTPCLGEGMGYRYISGRSWLLYQALTGYGLMSGAAPDFSAMEEVMR